MSSQKILALLIFFMAACRLPATAAAAKKPQAKEPLAQAPVRPAAPAPEQPLDPALQQVVRDALAQVAAGKLDAAIALLEPLRSGGRTPPTVALSLLGGLYLEAGKAAEAQAVLGPLAAAGDADPAVLYNAGRAALALGQKDDGRALLERSVEKVPSSPAARELGLLYGGEGRRLEAYRLLRPWALSHTDDTEARLAAALCALDLERPSEADELLAGLSTDDPKVRLLRGQLLLERQDPRAAIEMLKPLDTSRPQEVDFNLRRVLADAYLQVGQSAEAVRLLTGFENRDPTTARMLAQAQYQGGDLDGALATLKPWADALLANEKPRAPLIVAALALSYGRLLTAAGRHQEAVDALAVALRLDPASVEAWQADGQALTALGRRDEATQALARFKKLAEERQKAQLAQGSAAKSLEGLDRAKPLLASRRYEEALKIAREEMAIAPDDPRPRMQEVKTLLLLRRGQEAMESARATLALAPGSADAYYQLGLCHMVLKQPKEAEAAFRSALKANPNHVATMNDLAVLLMLRGDKPEARKLLERVLAVSPGDALAADNLRKLKAEGAKAAKAEN